MFLMITSNCKDGHRQAAGRKWDTGPSVGRPFRAVYVGLERPTYGYFISCRLPCVPDGWARTLTRGHILMVMNKEIMIKTKI